VGNEPFEVNKIVKHKQKTTADSMIEYNLTTENFTFENDSTDIQRCIQDGTCYTFDTSNSHGPLKFVFPLLGIMMPILAGVTVISNTIIIIILSRPGMQSPTNCVLLSMAVCDLCTILIPTPWYIFLYSLGHHEDNSWTGLSCYLYDLLCITVPQAFHTASNWLTLALAVQRYIYVCHAPMAKQWCTVSRSWMFVSFIILGALTQMMPRVLDRNYEVTTAVGAAGVEKEVCLVHFSSWTISVMNFYFMSFWWFRVIFVQVVPCISLVILNILLFSAMRRAEQRRRRLTINRTNNNEKRNASTAAANTKSKRGTIGRRLSIFGFNSKEARDRRQRDANSTTMMLIVVIAVFLAVELPLSTMTALHTISSSFENDFLDYELVGNITLFINCFICLSYPLNFAIYCGMSRQFRTTFRALFVTPLKSECCGGNGDRFQELDHTTVISGNKRLESGAVSTKVSKVTSATCSDTNGLLTTNL